MERIKNVVAGMLLLCALAPSLAVAAEDDEDLRTTVEALKQRLRDQDRRIAELEARQATSGPTTVESQKEQIKQVVREMKADKKEGLATPSWLEGVKLSGDLRLRGETQCFDWDKTSGEAKKTRNRARFRLRVGLTKTWLEDQLETTFRLASGSDNDPTSTNQTFTDNFSKKPVWIDLAYARYSPKAVKGLALIGGKMKTPWVTNEIFLDSDVNPEGFWAEYTAPKLGAIEPFVGAGYFVLRESADDTDVTMGAYQAGVKVAITKDVKYTLAGVYQDYQDYAASGTSARGNDNPLTQVPDFRVIGASNALEFPLWGKPVALFADLAHNCAEGDPTDEYTGQDNAYAAGIKYGQNKKKGDWSLKYRYAWIEADSLPGYFVDSDFGFGNRRGHVLGGEYNLLDSLTLGANVFFTEPIFSPTTTSGSSPDEDMTTTLMVDLVWKF